MKTTKILLSILLAATLISCSKDDDTDPVAESLYEEEGYVVASLSQSTAGFSYYAGYFNALPSGDLDMTKKTAYGNFFVRTSHRNFIYTAGELSDKKLSKQAILKSSGAIIEVASIPLLDAVSAVSAESKLPVRTTLLASTFS